MGTASRDFERDREDEIHCRICASDIPRNDGVHIFAEDGRRHYLQTKIRKYLYILVSLSPLRVNQRDRRCMRAYMYIHTVSCVGLTCVRIFFSKTPLGTPLPDVSRSIPSVSCFLYMSRDTCIFISKNLRTVTELRNFVKCHSIDTSSKYIFLGK